MTTRVTLHELLDADARETGLARRAAGALERAVNHPDFAGRVAAAPYRETRYSDGTGYRSLPPAEIQTIIAEGRERGTEADNEIDLAIRIVPLPEDVIGSTTPGVLPFCTARWFIDGCRKHEDLVSLARHFIHEWLHVAGFVHFPDNDARGDVPYLIGDIVRDLLLQAGLPENPRLAEALEKGHCGAAGKKS